MVTKVFEKRHFSKFSIWHLLASKIALIFKVEFVLVKKILNQIIKHTIIFTFMINVVSNTNLDDGFVIEMYKRSTRLPKVRHRDRFIFPALRNWKLSGTIQFATTLAIFAKYS